MAHPCRIKPNVARERLARLGMTQTSLASACHVELRTVQRWFAGASVALVDAECVAAVLCLGTEEVFDDVPKEGGTAFARVRDVMRVWGQNNGTLAQAMRISLEHFEFFDRHVSFAAHPARGFVRRLPMRDADKRHFEVFGITLSASQQSQPTTIAFHAQVGLRFRYEFGEVVVRDGEARLSEHFHTRTSCASLDDGAFHLWLWVPSEMRELVVVSNAEIDIVHARRGGDLFDLRDERTRHAVCFRPAPMHLRSAGLAPTFDRVSGPREGRIDEMP